jgi:hypothetical protein
MKNNFKKISKTEVIFRLIIGMIFLVLAIIVSFTSKSRGVSYIIILSLSGLGFIFSFITGILKKISKNLFRIILGLLFTVGFSILLVINKDFRFGNIILLGLIIMFTLKSVINKFKEK